MSKVIEYPWTDTPETGNSSCFLSTVSMRVEVSGELSDRGSLMKEKHPFHSIPFCIL